MGIDIDLYIYSISPMALPAIGQDRTGEGAKGKPEAKGSKSPIYIYIIIVYFISTVSGYLPCLCHLVERGLSGG